MDYLAKHQEILRIAATGKLPKEIDNKSEIPVETVRELYEAGLLTAIDAGSFDGLAYMEARITVAGREYLNKLEARDVAPVTASQQTVKPLADLAWESATDDLAASMDSPTARLRDQGTRNIYINNDLAHAALLCKERISARLQANDKKGIAFEYMTCMILLAFTFEARINFVGQRVMTPWVELRPTKDKVKAILKHLKFERDWNKPPYSSIDVLKEFRELIAHGKPINESYDEVILHRHEIDSPQTLDGPWVKFCEHEKVFGIFEDVDEIWEELLKVARIPHFETLTHGSGSLSVIAEPPHAP